MGPVVEAEMLDDKLKDIPSAGVVLGPGANNNSFIGVRMEGFEHAVVTLTEDGKGPEGNQFIGGEYKRAQQNADPSQASRTSSDAGVKPSERPWYREPIIAVLTAVVSALVVGALYWLGLPH